MTDRLLRLHISKIIFHVSGFTSLGLAVIAGDPYAKGLEVALAITAFAAGSLLEFLADYLAR